MGQALILTNIHQKHKLSQKSYDIESNTPQEVHTSDFDEAKKVKRGRKRKWCNSKHKHSARKQKQNRGLNHTPLKKLKDRRVKIKQTKRKAPCSESCKRKCFKNKFATTFLINIC